MVATYDDGVLGQANELHHEFVPTKSGYWVEDQLGSVRAVVRDGTVVEWNDYYAYGAVRDGATWSDNGRWKYLGKELDNETATQHLDAREYDPLVGIFNKPDRFEFKYPAYTPYGYSKQNPFLFSDPSGDSALIREGDRVPNFFNPGTFINPVDVYLSVNPLAALRSGIKWLADLVRRFLREEKSNGENLPSKNGDSGETTELFRGVRKYTNKGEVSPAYEDALNGEAKPRGGIFGHEDPVLHNEGNTQDSKFTSWTTEEDFAKRFAGKEGVVLKKEFPKNKTVQSPNRHPKENEVLIKGKVKNAEVIKK